MRDDDDGARASARHRSGRSGQRLQRRTHPRLQLIQAFTSRNLEPRFAGLPARVVLWMACRDLIRRQTFEYAERTLAQSGVRSQTQPRGSRHRLRCLNRASEITRDNPNRPCLRQAPRHRVRLAYPSRRERAVALSLNPALTIPQRLTMADDQKLRHRQTFLGSLNVDRDAPPPERTFKYAKPPRDVRAAFRAALRRVDTAGAHVMPITLDQTRAAAGAVG